MCYHLARFIKNLLVYSFISYHSNLILCAKGYKGCAEKRRTSQINFFLYQDFFCCSPHPYIFFNHDRVSMTFLGFLLNRNGDLLNPGTNTVLEKRLVDSTLRGQLKHQGVDFDANYEKRDRLD